MFILDNAIIINISIVSSSNSLRAPWMILFLLFDILTDSSSWCVPALMKMYLNCSIK